MENWEWPQYAYIGLIILSLVLNAALHGTPKTGNHNVLLAVIGCIISLWILISGGFFE